jgi:hypothetical protein
MWKFLIQEKVVIKRQVLEMVEPTAEEVRGWLDQSVGKYHKNQLNEMLQNLMEGWVNEDYNGETLEETNRRNSIALGKAQQLAEIILTLEEMCINEETID